MAEESESVGTVVVAVVTSLGIAAAKAVGGVVSGSSAMLSEAAHSVADAVAEVLSPASPKRSAKPADEAHPLGYGPERYVRALLASVATFVGAAVFAVYDGIHTLVRGEEPGDPAVSYVVLAVAFVREGYALLVAGRRTKGEAPRTAAPPGRYVKAVPLGNVAALIGLSLAAGGLLGARLTGSRVYDGVASLLIGLLLAGVAWELGRSNAGYLIGRPLPAAMRAEVREELLSVPHIEGVLELTTLVQGPAEVLIAAKIDFHDLASARQVEAACEDAEDQLRERFPAIRRVYLNPTPTPTPPPTPTPTPSPAAF
ncbi:cation diffusion facilitator family transporter [Streptomyces sp. APSN-46.1]|uniref:cation diffusion facilitator family transporter n=1 Tax=Streptomyces sp. APSN-46.1 TaxID=2929049 RepID=UPI001FB300FD|nr:cation diffusion facilitator family transporter [Streptomyces sp. APSN-46.1]MCJ1677223.1 cation diffusion facilitator family transporter [Streptomyces sp. APSN-46.1]